MSKPKSVINPLTPGPSDNDIDDVPKGFAASSKGMRTPSLKSKEIPNMRPPKAGKMKMPNFKSKSIKGSGM